MFSSWPVFIFDIYIGLIIKQFLVEHGSEARKRKFGRNQKVMKPPHGQKYVEINQQMKKHYHKRAREYNSDEDDETTALAIWKTRSVASLTNRGVVSFTKKHHEEEDPSEDEGAARGQRTQKKHVTDKNGNFDDGDDEIQPGTTKFTQGCKAFKMAFKSIINKSISDDLLVS